MYSPLFKTEVVMWALIVVLIICTIIPYLFKPNETHTFIKIFQNTSQPALIIDNHTKQIKWFNSNFHAHFPHIKEKDSINELNPQYILQTIYIIENKNEWLASNINLKTETGITLSLTNKTTFQWWKDLPFATALLTENLQIEEENEIFKELIDKSQYHSNIDEFKNIIELAKVNHKQEFILYSKEGIYPAKIWISPLEQKHLIVIESRIEYIRLKNKAQESQHLQILGQLTSSIIHDFNNLLTCIYGFTEILDEKIPNDENVEQIKTNINQASNLAKELLNFIKEKPIEQKMIQPKIYIPHIQNMMQKLLGRQIKLEIKANTEGSIKISDTQLERILLNMVINSKDAMPNGGVFKINTTRETISKYMKTTAGKVLKPGIYYVINVIDTGTGIHPEHLSKIFQTLFTTKKKGTGLGLSSCLKIAEHAGGTIKVSSSSKGTMFSIMIPLEKSSTGTEPYKPSEPLIKNTHNDIKNDIKTTENIQNFDQNEEKSSQKLKIILVEDEEPIRNLVKKSLDLQYEIFAYGDGESALKAIHTIKFDCLITDAVLPEVDGIRLAHDAILAQPHAKIFIVSGYDLATINDKLPPHAIYVSKPFTLKHLKEKITANLSS